MTIEQILPPIVGGIIGACIGVALTHLRSKVSDRLRVVRITRSGDPFLTGVLELYSSLFPADGTNLSCEDIITFFPDESGPLREDYVVVEDILLAGIMHKEVVGFILAHYFPEPRTAILSYFGIDKSSQGARNSGATILLQRLRRILARTNPQCEWLVFELHHADPGLDQETNNRRDARAALFKQTAKQLRLRAAELMVDYVRPKWCLEPQVVEEPMRLMCCPLVRQIALHALPKDKAMHLLEAMYLYCYGAYYTVGDPRLKVHQEYLRHRLKMYELVLPDPVEIR